MRNIWQFTVTVVAHVDVGEGAVGLERLMEEMKAKLKSVDGVDEVTDEIPRTLLRSEE